MKFIAMNSCRFIESGVLNLEFVVKPCIFSTPKNKNKFITDQQYFQTLKTSNTSKQRITKIRHFQI